VFALAAPPSRGDPPWPSIGRYPPLAEGQEHLMGGVSESDSAQPQRAESTVPVRYTLPSLANLLDLRRRFADGEAPGARNGDTPAAVAPGHPGPGDPGGR